MNKEEMAKKLKELEGELESAYWDLRGSRNRMDRSARYESPGGRAQFENDSEGYNSDRNRARRLDEEIEELKAAIKAAA